MPASADHLLAPEQYPDINRRFYEVHPADYFSTRLHMLALAGARPNLIESTLQGGVRFGSLEFGLGPDDHWDEKDVRRFTVTESVVLLHHAAEACLRLFFAHERDSECPWLETARLKRPREFKERLEAFVSAADDADQLERIAKWTLGRTVDMLHTEGGEPGRAGIDALQGSRDLLVQSASRLLSEGNMYNAAKHGLSVLPQERGVRFVFGNSDIDLSVQGASLTYLETKESKPGQRPTWHETTTWVNTDSWIAWTYLVIKQMRNIWAMGRFMHLAERGMVHPILSEQVDGIRKLGAKTYNIESISSQLVYYVDEVPPH